MLPLSAITNIIAGIVSLTVAIYLAKKKKNTFTFHFQRFFLYMSFFMFFMGLPLILSSSSFIHGWGYIIGHIFLYIAVAHTAAIAVFALKPEKNSSNIYFLALILGGIITLINIYSFNFPSIDPATGIAQYNVSPVVGLLIPCLIMVVWLPTAIILLSEGFKNRKRGLILLGVGLFILLVAGPLHDYARTVIVYLVADALTLFAFLIMFVGLLISYFKKEDK